MQSNAWITARQREAARRAAAQREGVATPLGPKPPPAVVVRGGPSLPVRELPGAAAVWIVGVHGGAGESTIAQLIPGAQAAGHAWPAASNDSPPPTVALVARMHATGLDAARRAASDWAAGAVQVNLLGLVLVADAPGRPPRPLRELAELVSGGVPTVWHIPWAEGWRQGCQVTAEASPRKAVRVAKEIAEAAGVARGDAWLTGEARGAAGGGPQGLNGSASGKPKRRLRRRRRN